MTPRPSPGKLSDRTTSSSLGVSRTVSPSLMAFVLCPCHSQWHRKVEASCEPSFMPGMGVGGSLFSGAQSLMRQTHKWTTLLSVTSVVTA